MDIANHLKKNIEGKVLTDHFSRHIYSVDASIYEVKPQYIVIPKSKKDLEIVVQVANSEKIPITARGAATSLTGAALGDGIVVDFSMICNNILDISQEKKQIICEPGLVQEELNRSTAKYNLKLGPDTSSGSRATIGGMIANNSSGAHSLRYGKMGEHVIELEILLSNGSYLRLKKEDEASFLKKAKLKKLEGEIYQTALDIRNHGGKIISDAFPTNTKCTNGYDLPTLLVPYPLNLSSIISGSEGTLGMITEATLNLVNTPSHTGLLLLFYDDLFSSFSHIKELLNFDPYSLEIIDHNIIEIGRKSPSLKGKLNWIKGNPKSIISFEAEGYSENEVKEKLEKVLKFVKKTSSSIEAEILLSEKYQNQFWTFRKLSLGLILSRRTYSRAYAFIEDFSIPPENLTQFFKSFFPLLESFQKKGGLYGHIGSGCLHFRPFINLSSDQDLKIMQEISLQTASLIRKNKGSLSGEHGDGLVRSWLLEDHFGKEVTSYFYDIKKAFDPNNIFNPGKIVSPTPFLKNLRSDAKTSQKEISTYLNFAPEGGFSLAVDLCNGNALCRKKQDLMCPTFQATNDEKQSTRARAQSLRSIIHGRQPLDAYASKELFSILDDCLECKGCKSECPSQVDMAKIKSEFLYQYYKKNKSSLRRYLFGHFPDLLNKTDKVPLWLKKGISNFPLSKSILNYIGIDSSIKLPMPSQKRFSDLYPIHSTIGKDPVILFIDTYSEFICPDVALSAIKVLKALKKDVIIHPWTCCGRTLISKGYLEKANFHLKNVIKTYGPFLEKNIPLIGLEPSCLYTLKDNMVDFHPKHSSLFKDLSYTLEGYLLKELKAGKSLPLQSDKNIKLLSHTHCHQKSANGNFDTDHILNPFDFIDSTVISSGCCGMAGSFGYEKEHSEISKKIAINSFGSSFDQPYDALLVNGFSCRHQISHQFGKKTMHLASLLAELIP